jgi:hypothetical protein
MLTAEEVKSFIKWYCNLVSNKNPLPGVYLTIKTEFSGIVEYSAELNVGEGKVFRTARCSNPYAAVCFLAAMVEIDYKSGGKKDEKGRLPTAVLWDTMQDNKMGGEPGIVLLGIEALTAV